MSDLATELRRAVDGGVAPVTASEARERAEHGDPGPRRMITAMTAAAMVVAVAVIAAVVLAYRSDGPRPSTSQSPDRSRSVAVGAVSLRLPTGWYRSKQPLAPWLADPHEILSVATAPIAPIDQSGNQAACPSEIPKAGVDAVGRNGIYVWIGEGSRAFVEHPGVRPKSFAQAAWGSLCELGNGTTTQGLTFDASGSAIVISVVIGPDASKRQRDEMYSMLDSLQIDRRSSAPAASACITGNRQIDSIPNLSPGPVNPARTFGVVPGGRGLLTNGKHTPVGDYLKVVWFLKSSTDRDRIEVVGRSTATGRRVKWARVSADGTVTAHTTLLESGQADAGWVSFPSAVLFPGPGCFEFTAYVGDQVEFGRIRVYYAGGLN